MSTHKVQVRRIYDEPDAHLRALARREPLTLLTATKEPDLSEAAVLRDAISRSSGRRR
ncbi:MAG: hypothetical protein ACRDV4_04235 [Acidimicrobiales bacterium]